MKVYRIDISSWTASFRYPNLISGFQPTLDVPPISTILGLINAAKGDYILHEKLKIGYYFEYEAKACDLESIYQIEQKSTKTKSFPGNTVKTNIIQREFLFDCKLCIYLQDFELCECLRKPSHPIVLGRSGDLATIQSVKELNLSESVDSDRIKGQVIPFTSNFIPGEIQALPKYFTNTIPRQNIGTEPYSVISYMAKQTPSCQLKTYTDNIRGKDIDIYFHELEFK